MDQPASATTIGSWTASAFATPSRPSAGWDLVSPDDHGRAHALHVGSFDVALAVGFLCAAWHPIRAYGMLPLVAAVVVGLGVTAAVDISEGQATVITETIHLLEVAGFAVLWLLSTLVRRTFRVRNWVQATSS